MSDATDKMTEAVAICKNDTKLSKEEKKKLLFSAAVDYWNSEIAGTITLADGRTSTVEELVYDNES